VALAQRAGILSKCDLATEMVGEFPELQGIAGYYYAQHDGEADDVALALNEQYLPKFAGDVLPSTKTGLAVAIADKLDTLVGIFGINQPPTGSKDPFGLRRAAIGLLRIIIEKELALDLMALIDKSLELYIPTIRGIGLADAMKKSSEKGMDIEDNYKGSLLERCERGQARTEIFDFLLGRYRAMYEEQGIAVDVIQSVQMLKSIPTKPLDFDRRIKAVANFRNLAEAEALAAANKRVANILSKDGVTVTGGFDRTLLVDAAEIALATQVTKLQRELIPLFHRYDYTPALTALAALRAPIDSFFDTVMVNADDLAIRQNRLNLLASLRALFLAVADISQLQ
jgi:glycyl-tRNA synthetase beta chain